MSTSVALFSVAGVKATLIIAQVIPFLILAIGVDNVFLLVHELDRQNERAHLQSAHPLFGDGNEEDVTSPEERVARTLGRMGPSILLSACCQTLAFGLGGAMVGMPAIRNFAIYAAGAVVVNFILQVTVFTSALVIDLRRVEVRDLSMLSELTRLVEPDRLRALPQAVVVQCLRSQRRVRGLRLALHPHDVCSRPAQKARQAPRRSCVRRSLCRLLGRRPSHRAGTR